MFAGHSRRRQNRQSGDGRICCAKKPGIQGSLRPFWFCDATGYMSAQVRQCFPMPQLPVSGHFFRRRLWMVFAGGLAWEAALTGGGPSVCWSALLGLAALLAAAWGSAFGGLPWVAAWAAAAGRVTARAAWAAGRAQRARGTLPFDYSRTPSRPLSAWVASRLETAKPPRHLPGALQSDATGLAVHASRRSTIDSGRQHHQPSPAPRGIRPSARRGGKLVGAPAEKAFGRGRRNGASRNGDAHPSHRSFNT
jgi:hypothetical protein